MVNRTPHPLDRILTDVMDDRADLLLLRQPDDDGADPAPPRAPRASGPRPPLDR